MGAGCASSARTSSLVWGNARLLSTRGGAALATSVTSRVNSPRGHCCILIGVNDGAHRPILPLRSPRMPPTGHNRHPSYRAAGQFLKTSCGRCARVYASACAGDAASRETIGTVIPAERRGGFLDARGEFAGSLELCDLVRATRSRAALCQRGAAPFSPFFVRGCRRPRQGRAAPRGACWTQGS